MSALSVVPDAPGRIAGHGPVSVIDIGSNSVRLVSYERLSRAPTPVFNEKALCGLGRGLAETGVLNEDAVEEAIAAIHRFKAISDQLNSVELFVLATAAAREAENGAEFIERVSEVSGTEPLVLSGEDEARYAALGVLSGIHNADGIIGDMGGGSLEVADIQNGEVAPGSTFPLGGLRLQDVSGTNAKKAAEIALKTLAQDQTLSAGKGRDFYAIGGTWRSLALLHLRQTDYPLHVLHHYAVPAKKMVAFCENVIKKDLDTIDGIEAVSKNRRPLLKYGAAVLAAVIDVMKPANIVVSALGLREGLLYEQLSEEDKEVDGLLAGAQEISLLRSRSPDNAFEIAEWTTGLIDAIGWSETDLQMRLRHAACLLSDVGWRAHPDYRGLQSINTIAHAAFVCIDHPGRAFIALSAYFRHEGQVSNDDLPALARLLEEDMLLRARVLGLAFRISHLISASMPGVLAQSAFEREGDTLVFLIDRTQADQMGERLLRRLGQIGKLVDLETEVRVKL